MVGFLQVLHRGLHGLLEYILFGPFGKSFRAFPYIKTIILHHVLNLHFASLVTWIHTYFLEWRTAEQESWKQAQTGEIVGGDGQRYYGGRWRSRQASSILTMKSSSMDLALTFRSYKSIDVHLMPSPNKAPCNSRDAIWKAKLLHSPAPLLEKNPLLTPLHERVKSKCMLEGPFTIWPPFPHSFIFLPFLKLPNAQLLATRSVKIISLTSPAFLRCLLSQTSKIRTMTCSFMGLQQGINGVKIHY